MNEEFKTKIEERWGRHNNRKPSITKRTHRS